MLGAVEVSNAVGISAKFSREPNHNSIETKTNNAGKDAKEDRDFLCRVRDAFRVFARSTSEVLGSAWAFVIAIIIIVIWGASGHIFNYSDTWQLIINTGTTIVTFLMVFLIQNTQNRDSKALHLKLDELIRSAQGARNKLVNLEKLSDDDLKRMEGEFERVRMKAERAEVHAGTAHEKADHAIEKVDAVS